MANIQRGNKQITKEWCETRFMELSEEYVVRKQLAARAIENFEILEESGMNVAEAIPIVEREQERFRTMQNMVDIVLSLNNIFFKEVEDES